MPRSRRTEPAAPTVADLERLHAQAIGRNHDLRVCNPAHSGFYALAV